MLEFKIVRHPDQIKKKLTQFNPQDTTWIVSDLKSKQEIQEECLEKYGFYSDDSVLRVSDFWKMWMRRLAPHIQIVSSEFIRVLVSQYIEKFGKELGLGTHESATLYKYISDLAPLILHDKSHENLKEWLKQKAEKPFWLRWEIIAQNCLKYILSEHRCIETRWTVSFLQTQRLEKIILAKKLIFDLGSQMSSLEMGLLNILAKNNDIEVIAPDPVWKSKFSYLLRTYNDYGGYGKKEVLPEEHFSNEILAQNFLRFSTEANEIKFATEKIRTWIESGVKPENIVILSPRIEDYWPTLKYHLDLEGVLTQKDLVSSTMSLGIIQRWLAVILAQTKNVTWSKLEMSYGTFHEVPELQQFEKFKALFAEMLDESDLSRLTPIQDLFFHKINLEDRLSRDQFLILMLKSWVTVDPTLEHKKLFQNVVKDFIQQTLALSFRVADWLDLLTSRLAKKEIKIEQAVKTGIQVLPINSAQILKATHRLWIGLDESGLCGKQNSLIPVSDIEELKRIFDLALEYPEESHADFNLRWYAQSSSQEQFFTCSQISVTGEPLSTSLYFLENNKEPKLVPEAKTLLDNEQRFFKIDDFPELKIKLELENGPLPLAIAELDFKTLSPSDLEAYSQCSFKLLARKGFQLQHYDQLGLEIDPRQRGNLVHDLFKFIVSDKHYLTLTASQLDAQLEKDRLAKNLFPNLDFFWRPQKEKLVTLGLRFIEIEKNRLATLKHLKHKTEETVQLYYDLKNQEFSAEIPAAEHFVIRGRLDRFDFDEQTGQGMVIDYKSSKSDRTHFAPKWVENSEFQLLLYSLAAEKLFSTKAVGAIYYFYKSLQQQYGYIVSTDNVFKDHVLHTKSTLISEDKKNEIQAEFKARIKEVFAGIEKNVFAVKPADTKICKHCEWTETCRINNQK